MTVPKVKSLISLGCADNANKAAALTNVSPSCDNARKEIPSPILISKVAGKCDVAVQTELPVPFQIEAPAPVRIEETPAPARIEEAPVPVRIEAPVKQIKRKVLDANAQCLHGTRRTICKHCKGNSLCEHLKQRQWCEICRPGPSGARCIHGKQRSKCVACGGTGICEHLKLRVVCSVCKYLKMQMI